MRYLALATDFDGTLAHDGRVEAATVEALKRLRKAGRRIVLATGRMLDDLLAVSPDLELFDLAVVENGALLYDLSSRQETPLGPPPPANFVDALRGARIQPLDVGRVLVATWQPHEATAIETIARLGLDLPLTFNKGAVMVAPAGITKASGLARALERLELSPHNVVAVGDAENDLAMLTSCEASVAVAKRPRQRQRALRSHHARSTRRGRGRVDRRNAAGRSCRPGPAAHAPCDSVRAG